MNIVDRVRFLWQALCAFALLVAGCLMALASMTLAVEGAFAPALGIGVLALVPLGPGMGRVGEALKLRREARDPLASVQPVKERRRGVWSVLGRLRMVVLFLSFGLLLTFIGIVGLVTHPGVGEVLFALAALLLGVTGLGMSLSALVSRDYWLEDNGGFWGERLSRRWHE